MMKAKTLVICGLLSVLSIGGTVAIATAPHLLNTLGLQPIEVPIHDNCVLTWDNTVEIKDGKSRVGSVELKYGSPIDQSDARYHAVLTVADETGKAPETATIETTGKAWDGTTGGVLNGLSKIYFKATRKQGDSEIYFKLKTWNTLYPQEVTNYDTLYYDGYNMCEHTVDIQLTPGHHIRPNMFKLIGSCNNRPELPGRKILLEHLSVACSMSEPGDRTITLDTTKATFADGTNVLTLADGEALPKIISKVDGYEVTGFYNVDNPSEYEPNENYFVGGKDMTIRPLFEPTKYLRHEDVNTSGGLDYFTKDDRPENGIGNNKPIWQSGASRGGTFLGITIPHQITPLVGREMDLNNTLRLHLDKAIVADSKFVIGTDLYANGHSMPKDPSNIDYIIKNNGSDPISFEFANGGSSGDPSKDVFRKDITLQPGEILEFNMKVKVTNNNLLNRFTFKDGATAMDLSIAGYFNYVAK